MVLNSGRDSEIHPSLAVIFSAWLSLQIMLSLLLLLFFVCICVTFDYTDLVKNYIYIYTHVNCIYTVLESDGYRAPCFSKGGD